MNRDGNASWVKSAFKIGLFMCAAAVIVGCGPRNKNYSARSAMAKKPPLPASIIKDRVLAAPIIIENPELIKYDSMFSKHIDDILLAIAGTNKKTVCPGYKSNRDRAYLINGTCTNGRITGWSLYHDVSHGLDKYGRPKKPGILYFGYVENRKFKNGKFYFAKHNNGDLFSGIRNSIAKNATSTSLALAARYRAKSQGKYVGEMRNGLLEGGGVAYVIDRKATEHNGVPFYAANIGKFSKNVIQGRGIQYDIYLREKETEYFRENHVDFKNGKKHGLAKMYWFDEVTSLKNRKLHSIVTGEYVNGEAVGKHLETRYTNGEPDRQWNRIYKNGKMVGTESVSGGRSSNSKEKLLAGAFGVLAGTAIGKSAGLNMGQSLALGGGLAADMVTEGRANGINTVTGALTNNSNTIGNSSGSSNTIGGLGGGCSGNLSGTWKNGPTVMVLSGNRGSITTNQGTHRSSTRFTYSGSGTSISMQYQGPTRFYEVSSGKLVREIQTKNGSAGCSFSGSTLTIGGVAYRRG
jgi:hypothetical protein